MKFIISADDYGASKTVTDDILDCVDNGILSTVSIIANGNAFDYAIEEYKKRPELRLSVHLNLVEGRPIVSHEEVPMLVNKDGELYHSFLSLWLKYLLCKQKERESLKQQVVLEISAQITKVIDKIDKNIELQIDSHQYFHMIPFVFYAILELKSFFCFSYIRMPEEPTFLCDNWLKSIKNYCSSNLIKHILLNSLSRKYKPILTDMQISYSDYLIGILFSGNMSISMIKAALHSLSKSKKELTVEILFHPFTASREEKTIWKKNKSLMKFYSSQLRCYERQTIKDPSLVDLLKANSNL